MIVSLPADRPLSDLGATRAHKNLATLETAVPRAVFDGVAGCQKTATWPGNAIGTGVGQVAKRAHAASNLSQEIFRPRSPRPALSFLSANNVNTNSQRIRPANGFVLGEN